MNTLSWMIYWAEVAGKFSSFAGMAVMFAIMGSITLAVFSSVSGDTWSWESEEKKAFKRALPGKMRRWSAQLAVLAGVLGLLGVFAPSSRTIYMVAASEAGEAVVTSEDGKAVLGDLQKLLRQKLKNALKDEVQT